MSPPAHARPRRRHPHRLARCRRRRARTIFVSNEKGNTITVIDGDTLEVTDDRAGRQPAARHRPQPRRQAALRLRLGRRHDPGPGHRDAQIVGTLPSGPDPELMDLSPDGSAHVRRQRGRQHGDRGRHPEPAGALGDPGRRRAGGHGRQPRRQVGWSTPPRPPTWPTSSTPTPTRSPTTSWSTSARASPSGPSDDAEVWVSAEIGGTVSVIDNATRADQARRSRFEIPGVPHGGDPAGRRAGDQGPQAGLRRPRPGQPGRGRQRPDLRGRGLPAGRPAGLAARLQPRREARSTAPTASPTTSRSSTSRASRSSSRSRRRLSLGRGRQGLSADGDSASKTDRADRERACDWRHDVDVRLAARGRPRGRPVGAGERPRRRPA